MVNEIALDLAKKDYKKYGKKIASKNGIPYLKFKNSIGLVCIISCPADFYLKMDTIKEIISPIDLEEIKDILKPNYLIGIISVNENLYIVKNVSAKMNLQDFLEDLYFFVLTSKKTNK